MLISGVLMAVALVAAETRDQEAVAPQMVLPIATLSGQGQQSVGRIANPSDECPVVPLDGDGGPAECDLLGPYKSVWGVFDGKLFPDARRMAPNGVPYHPIASLDLDFNFWLWRSQRIYLFGIARFWTRQDDDQPLVAGPRDGPRASWNGLFNWSKREYDILPGAAWNYWGAWEARVFAYSMNNLNRGLSLDVPTGFNDGVGVENRYYLSPEYARLGREGYNISRATFLSVGYYPSKVMVGLDGKFFAPGPFVRGYLTWDIPGTWCYLFADTQLTGKSSFQPKLLQTDAGLALVPFRRNPMFEFRLGSEVVADYQSGIIRSNALPYLSLRLNY